MCSSFRCSAELRNLTWIELRRLLSSEADSIWKSVQRWMDCAELMHTGAGNMLEDPWRKLKCSFLAGHILSGCWTAEPSTWHRKIRLFTPLSGIISDVELDRNVFPLFNTGRRWNLSDTAGYEWSVLSMIWPDPDQRNLRVQPVDAAFDQDLHVPCSCPNWPIG